MYWGVGGFRVLNSALFSSRISGKRICLGCQCQVQGFKIAAGVRVLRLGWGWVRGDGAEMPVGEGGGGG